MNLHATIAARLRCHTTALLRELQDPACPDERLELVCRALAQSSDPRARDELRRLMERTNLDDELRERASETLLAFSHGDGPDAERTRAWWDSGDPLLQTHALAVAPEFLRAEVMEIAAEPRHPLHRQAIDGMRFEFGDPSAERLKLRATLHPDPKVRFAAAENLITSEPVGAVEALSRLSQDDDECVATLALRGLKFFPSRQAIDSALNRNGSDAGETRQELRDDVDRGLAEDGVGDGVRAWIGEGRLKRLYRRTTRRVPRTTTAAGIDVKVPEDVWGPKKRASIGLRKALELLTKAETSLTVIETLFKRVLWRMAAPSVRRQTVALLRNHDDVVRRMGLVKIAACWEDVDLLVAMLEDPEPMVQRATLHQLSKRPPAASAARALERFLRRGDVIDVAACEALDVFARHAGREAIPLLSDWAADDARCPSVRDTALCALAASPLGTAHLPFLARQIFAEEPWSWSLSKTLVREATRLGFLSKRSVAHLRGVDDLNLVVALARFDAARS